MVFLPYTCPNYQCCHYLVMRSPWSETTIWCKDHGLELSKEGTQIWGLRGVVYWVDGGNLQLHRAIELGCR